MHSTAKWRIGALTVAAATAVALAGGSAAVADPTGSPTYRPINGTGSDTTQDVMNGLASVVTNGGARVLGSYDALGTATITTRSGGPAFARPDGSGAGYTALKAAQSSGTYQGTALTPADLQFSRSSSAPSTVAPDGRYSYIPFGVDAVSYAFGPASLGAVPTDIPSGVNPTTGVISANLDSDGDGILDLTLANIYTRNVTTTLEDAAGNLYTVGNAASGADIIPLLPQANSGSRKFWLKTLTGSETGKGAIVSDTFDDDGIPATPEVAIQENDGTAVAQIDNAIMPFSVAQWIAQSKASSFSVYGISVTDRRNTAVLGSIDGQAPSIAGQLNTAFTVKRPVFNVVEHADLAANPVLNTVFGTTGAGSIYDAKRPGSTTLSVINDFGFGSLPATIFGKTYTAGDTASYRTNS